MSRYTFGFTPHQYAHFFFLMQTVSFEPLVTSSALVDLTSNGLGDRAQTVVGGFTNDSLTYVRFSLDPR